ncbi:MAG: GreA/GreB family elongation factor, partial [Clostridia bacterium]|nr:GreA/GreB family elongation factor [Clostridia bacterium]
KIKAAEIIKSSGEKDVIAVGMKIKILDLEFSEEDTYEIVGTTEANIASKRISNECPLGRALVGRKVGETVTVATPSKDDEYSVKILEIVG